jgi:hypothetical protein
MIKLKVMKRKTLRAVAAFLFSVIAFFSTSSNAFAIVNPSDCVGGIFLDPSNLSSQTDSLNVSSAVKGSISPIDTNAKLIFFSTQLGASYQIKYAAIAGTPSGPFYISPSSVNQQTINGTRYNVVALDLTDTFFKNQMLGPTPLEKVRSVKFDLQINGATECHNDQNLKLVEQSGSCSLNVLICPKTNGKYNVRFAANYQNLEAGKSYAIKTFWTVLFPWDKVPAFTAAPGGSGVIQLKDFTDYEDVALTEGNTYHFCIEALEAGVVQSCSAKVCESEQFILNKPFIDNMKKDPLCVTDALPPPPEDPNQKPEPPFNLCGQIPGSLPDAKAQRDACCKCATGSSGAEYSEANSACAKGEIKFNDTTKPGLWTAVGCIDTSKDGLIKSFMRIGLGIAGGVALLTILIASFILSTSQGNPKRTGEAKEMLTNAIIGLLFIIFSVTILQFIGVTILQIPGFGK